MPSANIKIRKSANRGHANHGWLESYFTFSFADYYDPQHMGFRTLRVINDDTVEPEKGFDTHRHRDMEIITYVIEGELQHKDSMGNGSIIKAGCVQRMTAGTGVAHSEFNPSQKHKVHLLQIWILPEKNGLAPSYQELDLRTAKRDTPLLLIGSNAKKKDLITIHQDVRLYHGLLKKDETINYKLENGRGLWLHLIKGEIDLLGTKLRMGDSAAVEQEENIRIQGTNVCEFLLFDLK